MNTVKWNYKDVGRNLGKKSWVNNEDCERFGRSKGATFFQKAGNKCYIYGPGSSSGECGGQCFKILPKKSDEYKKLADKYKIEINNLKKKISNNEQKFNDLQISYNELKEVSANASSVKDKAVEIFRLLENQYIDRLDRIKTQQNLLSKQTSLINAREDTIEKQKKALEEQNDKIHTNSRVLLYDEQDDRTRLLIQRALQYTAFILLILIIFYKKFWGMIKGDVTDLFENIFF